MEWWNIGMLILISKTWKAYGNSNPHGPEKLEVN
jgi:hypothetical protein